MTARSGGSPLLALRAVASRPPAGAAASDVTLEVGRGRVSALLGAPGHGKTAVLRAISGLDRPDTGNVVVEGANVSRQAPHLRGVGYVPHGLALASELSIADNIRFGLRTTRRSGAEHELGLAELLRVVDLPERGNERVASLSLDERLRVSIARSLTTDPLLLLLDEPLGSLRNAPRDLARQSLRVILRRLTVGVLLATSDPDDAAALADDTAVIELGRVTQTGTTSAVLGRPATVSVARLAGYEVLLQGRVEGDRVSELGVGSIALPGDIPRDTVVHVMAHPAGVLAVPRGHGLGSGVTALVAHARPLGPLWLLEVTLGNRAAVLARWEWDAEAPPVGSQVELAATAGVGFYVAGKRYDASPAARVAPTPPGAQAPDTPRLPLSSTG